MLLINQCFTADRRRYWAEYSRMNRVGVKNFDTWDPRSGSNSDVPSPMVCRRTGSCLLSNRVDKSRWRPTRRCYGTSLG